MLTTLVEKLTCPTCFDNGRTLVLHTFSPGPSGHARDGVLTCSECLNWYPIEDGLLELVVAPLLDPSDVAAFRARFASQLRQIGLVAGHGPDFPDNAFAAQRKQRGHFDWYAENTTQDYSSYQRSPFWEAADNVAFRRWQAMIQPGSWLLDVGCANGRSAFAFVRPDRALIGFDISKKLVRQAIARARAERVEAATTFFVADGSRLPFRDQTFDYVLIYGVLHHLPSPRNVCRDVPRILKPGGIYFGSENNKSLFRNLFDLLMKLTPLWTEEAGEEALLSRRMIRCWLRGTSVHTSYATSVFLPPHLFNLVGRKAARALLRFTDWVCSCVPGLRHHGGLLVFEVKKN